MSKTWPTVTFESFLRHRKDFFRIDDLVEYKRARVQLHWKGIVLRDQVLGAEIKTKKQQAARGGELLVAEIDAKVGGAGIVPPELDGAIVSSHYFLFEIDEAQCLRRWLDLFIRSGALEDQLVARGSTNYAAIRPHHVLACEIPLPALDEQRRIGARIEELSAKIEEARSLRQQATDTQLPTMWNVIASRALGGQSPHGRLGEVCSLITDGTHQTPRYTDDGYMFLSAQNVKPFRFMPQVHRKVSFEDYRACVARAKPQKGDVLLTRVGAMIGEAAVLDRDLDFAFYVSLGLIRPVQNRLLPSFLVHWLNSPGGLSQSRGQTLGKGHSQGNLNLKLLRNFTVPLPSLSEQRRTVAYLDDIRAKIDSLKGHQEETSKELNALMPSILSKAFSGELVQG